MLPLMIILVSALFQLFGIFDPVSMVVCALIGQLWLLGSFIKDNDKLYHTLHKSYSQYKPYNHIHFSTMHTLASGVTFFAPMVPYNAVSLGAGMPRKSNSSRNLGPPIPRPPTQEAIKTHLQGSNGFW